MNTYNLTGPGLCAKRKDRHITLQAGNSDAVKKTAFEKKLLKENMFAPSWDEAEIREQTGEYFAGLNFPSPETARIHAGEASDQVIRYLTSETRKASAAPVKTLDLFGVKTDTAPDFIFKGIRSFTEGTGKNKQEYSAAYLEAVMVKCRKPDVTVRGRKQDAGIMTNMELYALLAYAKEMVHGLLEEDTRINVGASFYFLEKDDDSDEHFDNDFFHMAKGSRPNVVTLWDTCTAGDRTPTAVDKAYRQQFESFAAGEINLSGSDTCSRCDFYTSCCFKEPPVPSGNAPGTGKGSLEGIVLTPTQEEAVSFRKGIARINAGAGAGKTLVVALRTARMLEEGIPPEDILLLTFTNAGAAEFRERIRSYTRDEGTDLGRLESTTFNSFGDTLIRTNYAWLGYAHEPELIDDVQRLAVIAEILRDNVCPGLDYRYFDLDVPHRKGALPVAAKAFDALSRTGEGTDTAALRDALGTDAKFITSDGAYPELIRLYGMYRKTLRERCLIEYSDQEQAVFRVLSEDPEYFAKKGYKHIIVDEFQDTNEVQFRILKALMDTPAFESLMVVGDDSQSIFGFRGSMPEFMVDFAAKLGLPCRDFFLLENHRSTPEIIRFANQVNSLNDKRVAKDLIATRTGGKPVSVESFPDTEKTDRRAVEAFIERHKAGIPYEDMAYIAYTRAELLRMGGLLSEEGIPWILTSPEPCLENSRIIGALALASFIDDPVSTKDLFIYENAVKGNRLLAELTDAEIEKYLCSMRPVAEKMKETEDESGFMDALRSVDHGCWFSELDEIDDEVFASFIESVKKRHGFRGKLKYCLDFKKYGGRQGTKREMDYPGIVLTTAHSSKGLEWPVVVNNLTKYDAKDLTDDEIEERRRLLFVSATRARDELYVIGKEYAYGSASKGNAVKNRYLEEAKEAAE